MQIDMDNTVNPETKFSDYYDSIDKTHADILKQCATMCRSNKHGFTDTNRLDAIRSLLETSEYQEVYLDTASVWLKGPIESDKEYYIVSSHADTVAGISSCYSNLDDNGYYHGTYDNVGTNAAAVIAMLEADLPNNVIFAFTADEETGRCAGARDLVNFIESLGITKETYIALDVTHEGYDKGHLATIENAPKADLNFLHKITESMLKTEPTQTMTYVRKSKKALPDNLPESYLSPDMGWCDEAFTYADLKKNTFSLCLPCDGNMHGQSGLVVRQPGFEGYIATLEGMLYDFTKTHEELIINKNLEKATLYERSQELLETERKQEELRKSSYNIRNTFLENYLPHSNYTSNFHNYDYDAYDYDDEEDEQPLYLEPYDDPMVQEELYGIIDLYDEDEREQFIDDAIATVNPDLYNQYMAMRSSFNTFFEEYHMQQKGYENAIYNEATEYSNQEYEVLGYTDDINNDFDLS